MMKKIILAFLAMTFFSCSKDSEPDKPVESSGKLIKVINTSLDPKNAYVDVINFTYSGDYVVSSQTVGSNDKTDYIYENGKLISDKYYHNGALSETNTYIYTGDLITSDIYTLGSVKHTYKYTYDSNSRVQKEESYSATNVLESTGVYEYDTKGNVSKKTWNGAVSTFVYDTNKTPVSLAFPAAYIKIQGEYGSPNNLTSSSGGETWSFKYNSSGYPTEAIHYWKGVADEKQEFFYK